jgi:trans-aconitate methyltransferase
MYQHEKTANFDSWHQDDSRQLNRKIALDILGSYNFQRIVDIGSGKGTLTHQLKKINNQVLGLDISPTAIEVARARFPDIEFDVADVE